jgi:hypothetical protein
VGRLQPFTSLPVTTAAGGFLPFAATHLGDTVAPIPVPPALAAERGSSKTIAQKFCSGYSIVFYGEVAQTSNKHGADALPFVHALALRVV